MRPAWPWAFPRQRLETRTSAALFPFGEESDHYHKRTKWLQLLKEIAIQVREHQNVDNQSGHRLVYARPLSVCSFDAVRCPVLTLGGSDAKASG